MVGAAAISKFADTRAFEAALRTWTLIPAALAAPLALLVPSIELAIAGAWVVGWNRRAAWLGLVLLLAVLTVSFIAHLVFVGVPECRCFGKLLRFRTKFDEGVFALARNGVLLILLLGGGFFGGITPARSRTLRAGYRESSASHARDVRNRPGAFSLVETIVAVMLIGVLIALVLPMLGRVREQAQEVLSRSNLRQHAANFSAYSGENADVWPYFTDPEADWTIIRTSGPTFRVKFFMAHISWHAVMADAFYGGNYLHPTLHAPWQQPRPTTTYYYADCFIARPEFWSPLTRSGPAQWKPTRADEVLFPSDKGLILENGEDEDGDGRRPAREDDGVLRFAAVDGSTGARAGFSAPYPTGTGQFRGSWLQTGWPVMHTIDGVRGRD